MLRHAMVLLFWGAFIRAVPTLRGFFLAQVGRTFIQLLGHRFGQALTFRA